MSVQVLSLEVQDLSAKVDHLSSLAENMAPETEKEVLVAKDTDDTAKNAGGATKETSKVSVLAAGERVCVRPVEAGERE